ncbi:MAG: glycosyltransferase family 4 protein [Planctomycetaceae bacterium]
MNVCIIFYNLGGYHLSRLAAARLSCEQRGWRLTAIEITRSTTEHPWGTLDLPAYVTTLVDQQPGDRPNLPDLKLLDAALNKLAPDAVAVPGWGHNFARRALLWCRANDRAAVLMCESKRDDAPRNWLKELWKKWRYVRRFDAALVGGQKHADYLVQLGMKPDQIFYRYDVVDTDFLVAEVDRLRRSAPAKRPLAVGDRPYILSVNRFIDRKNLLTLIDAFCQAIQADGHDWDLVLLGAGTQESTLRNRVQELGLSDRIHFPGFCSYSDIVKWYAFAEIFVHPAMAEQWGLVVNEAMAAELPIVLSNACGCHPDLLEEGQNGFSFSPDDTSTLMTHLQQLMDDESGRKRMGQRSRKIVVDQFSPAEFGNGLCNAVAAALEDRQFKVRAVYFLS